MNIRSQIAMVFHLDKCIGCHTCSVACKNVWTDRKGTEYMWWNNVETKPGTGYPTKWEDQEKYKGGWEKKDDHIEIRSTGKTKVVPNIFHNPHMPSMDDYYEPWTRLSAPVRTPEGDDQRRDSCLDGHRRTDERGSRSDWDDDRRLAGYAAMIEPGGIERTTAVAACGCRATVLTLPRIYSHCRNPCCVAACPSGALYQAGRNGLVPSISRNAAGGRASRLPTKTFYNWAWGSRVHSLLSSARDRAGARLFSFVRGADSLPGSRVV
jgi:nitrate reductase beta subunit